MGFIFPCQCSFAILISIRDKSKSPLWQVKDEHKVSDTLPIENGVYFLSPRIQTGLGLLLPIDYTGYNPMLALGLPVQIGNFCLVLLEDSHRRRRTTILRSPCCEKLKPHGEALAEDMSRGDRGAKEHRDAELVCKEANLEVGPPTPAAPPGHPVDMSPQPRPF